MSYEKLTAIGSLNFRDKSVLIIGAGWMADQFCQALTTMRIGDVTVLSRREESARSCAEKYGYKALHGGYEKALPQADRFDLIIVATPIHELMPAAREAVVAGGRNLLVEKPASLYSGVLHRWAQETKESGARIRVAFNRLTYPSLWKLKALADEDGGITSCDYMFTEWIHTINFTNNKPDVYTRWGIANSLHVIGMAHALIGLPKEMHCMRAGDLDWHRSGSRFSGCGVTEAGIVFSYHADWTSAGRWGVEVMTPRHAYRLIPLEALLRCPRGSVNWAPVELAPAYPAMKTGVAEEIAVMLDGEMENLIPLVTLKQASGFTGLAEKIFGYLPEPVS